MSETFFISDTHFGHKGILEYEPIHRPFSCVEDMNEAIIERWNKVVNKHDKVYHLGDFCFGKSNMTIADRLNGQKRLVMGNHDCYPASEYLKYFLSIHGVLFLKDIVMTHVPVHLSQLEHRSKYNIHGHLHSKKLDDKRYICVSVEQNNLTPVNMDEIKFV